MHDTDPAPRRVLVTDFDGTLTRHDFYRLVSDDLLPPGAPDYWGEYRAGRLTHFEALRALFAAARPDEEALWALARRMGLDPEVAAAMAALREAGWEVVVASAGCAWYIHRLLAEAGVAPTVHANPGHVEGGRLRMEPPTGSPYYAPATGIDKAAVVRASQAGGRTVAYAGDGPPDLEPALLVPARFRFARGDLAAELGRCGEAFRPFERWSEVARALAAEDLSC